ncbi:Uncharacterized protein TCM_042674 [Theobroma cacao]|uniref:Disease resistance N-terminal domain-containing protein n=1 Tax=Theobroma cacao TaxID=3641 RepID=A0A061FM48_THECC|nr:Uncharacterized protein TCM_042674 [Theobroma cacao]
MAEAIVSLAIERISDLLIHVAVFLHGVREEVEDLKAELQRMKSSLIDADRKQDQDELTCTLVSQIRILLMKPKMLLTTSFFKSHMKEAFMDSSRDSPSLFVCTKSGSRSKQSRLSLKAFLRIFRLIIGYPERRGLALFSRCSSG